jgi:sterol desaturase/sphingolipid hydroxylase (fatty acid hydroxylase superfamily)
MQEVAKPKVLLSYVQPVMVAAIVLFWAFGPAGWIANPWSIVIATLTTTALIQALEWVNERHSSWRLTRREFFTDVFYVVLSYTVIAWATKTFADEPMMAAKQALGIATPWAMHLPFVVQVALIVVLIEFGQYWLHRLMHNQSFFWSTHAPHHHLTQLNA